MFIQTEPTHDQATLKFLPGREVLPKGTTLIFRNKEEAAKSTLAERLFAVPGVSNVYCGSDFIAVTKNSGDWQRLKPMILGAIMEHFMSGAPIAPAETKPEKLIAISAAQADLIELIKAALRQVIDPELGYNIIDLGLVYDVSIEGSTARVVMTTTTRGCPATDYLQQGAHDRANSVPGLERVDIELTYEPSWMPEMMSPEAKAHFGIRDGGGR
jgi:metal-sulfur cluster biosynthetic enzyme